MNTTETTTLTVHLPHLAPHTVEAQYAGPNGFVYAGGYGVLAGRTATKVRHGALSFRLADETEAARFEAMPEFRRNTTAHAIDEQGRVWLYIGASASGNKGSHGYRVVGHTDHHGVEITAQV